jgi:hypothetical protein
MRYAAALCALGILSGQQPQAPEGLLARVADRVNSDLDRMPDFVCQQTVQRFGRFGSERPWERIDTLQLEVGMSGNRELYSWSGSKEFQDQQLADLVGRGVIGTGHFAMLARHVFLPGATGFTYKGQSEINGRPAHEWDYDVPVDRSRYRLRTGAGEAVTAFQGTVWADVETLALVRLDVVAYDIPEKLGLAEAANIIHYSELMIGQAPALLPAASELTLVATDGHESHNRLKLGDCRQFRGEATVSFDAEDRKPAAAEAPAETTRLPFNSVLELELAEPLEPDKAALGNLVRLLLSRPLKDDTNRILVPEGAEVTARLVRLEKSSIPYPLWEVGLEPASVKLGENQLDLSATMYDAGPETGLVRQSRRFMPTFTRKRSTRMDILVRETPKGQGVLHWDARRSQIPKGLKMKWRVE